VPTKHILIFTEHAPPRPDRPASGLAIRHARIAAQLAGRGLDVTCAWPASGDSDAEAPEAGDPGVEYRTFESPADLARWCQRRRPDAFVLGYWELADWLPRQPVMLKVLDYVAPRLLERQFEDRDRLTDDLGELLPLLARCDDVWVGNARQADMMLTLLLLAGHDCRERAPLAVVPIAGRVADDEHPPKHDAPPRTLFHGGRDWPWRQSGRWLDAVRELPDDQWRLDDGSERSGFGTLGDYDTRLRAADAVLELSDDNIERRFSLSFRAVDALCAGRPVICNRFLPLAGPLEQAGAGWSVDTPDELLALLVRLADSPDELRQRGERALALARREFDAESVYGGLAGRLRSRIKTTPEPAARRPLVAAAVAGAGPERPARAWRKAVQETLRDAVHYRLRLPFHRWLGRRLRHRPRPEPGNRAWVITSRRDLFPTNHGAAVKIERTAWGLSFQIETVVLLTDRRDGCWIYRRGEREWRAYPAWMRIWGWPRVINRTRLIARGLPGAETSLYLPLVDRGMHLRLMWLLNRYPVDVVSGEFPACAHPAVWASRLFGTRSLMVEHNVEYRRIADQYDDLSESARLWLKRVEVDLANACDRVITVSERDREMLVDAGVREALIHTIPHGVDLTRFRDAPRFDWRADLGLTPDHLLLVYHGIYSYPPNLEAVQELSNRVLPELARRGVSARVLAIGPEPPDVALPGVTFAGAVDDLAARIKGADLAVVPLRKGGGTRMKILDYFAAGVPVISTAKGMEGLPIEPDRHLRMVEDPDDIAAAIIELQRDPKRARGLAEQAGAWVGALDWRAIAARYVELVDALPSD